MSVNKRDDGTRKTVNRLAIGEIKLIPPKKYAETNRMEIEQEIEAQTDERMVVNTRTLIGKIILTVRISAGDNTQSPNVAEKESKTNQREVISYGNAPRNLRCPI